MTLRPYTPDTLAARWQCSAETVRQLIKRGELRAFRVGVMYRVPVDAVEEYECRTSPSDACEAASAPSGVMPAASDTAISLRHATERRRKQKPSTYTAASNPQEAPSP